MYSGFIYSRLQPNLEIKAKQLEMWRSLVCSYCQAHNLCVAEASSAYLPMFKNSKISRELSQSSIIQVLSYMVEKGWTSKLVNYTRIGNAQWIVSPSPSGTRGKVMILWKTLNEWAMVLQDWVVTFQKLDNIP
eukprot:Filipodium_phascolosomae@DN937_c0_g1_i2.p1